MEKQTTHQYEDLFPIFNGKDGYEWRICLEQHWNFRGTPEEQRFMEVEIGLQGRALTWFQLWKSRNPFADLETCMTAFYHPYQQHMRPILPDIFYKEVEDWEIVWENMKARLLLQLDPETTKPQPEQTNASKSLQEENSTEILDPDQAEVSHLDPDPATVINNADPSLVSVVTPTVSCSNLHVVVTPSSGRVVQGGWLCRASLIAAKPPSLLATVLPWNCHSPRAESDDSEGVNWMAVPRI
ncbi:hypothetical protein PIB30_082644 [Stylosanthes scabra]|uniref:Retrotransposon gag domain-containing protein n=1 Tax=Stylosanthes scabra TaxID=79078 RepID=A0ABU6WQD8_9FABA|nr:hypothetical protein [Stylosanthes scabra]